MRADSVMMNVVSTRRILTVVTWALGALLTGCFETRMLPAVVPTVGSSTMEMIGAAGGSLQIDDLLITVPPGAVTGSMQVRVIVDAPSTSGAFTLFSPIIRFEPAGLALLAPIEVRIPFHGDPRLANVFSAASGGGAFAARTTQISGDIAIAHLEYLESTFVGTACEGDGCSCEPNGQLDLLLVVDNSNSMQEEQILIQEQLPRLFRALATGDIDGDGVQDRAAFDSVRVGITTVDMGAGAAVGVPTCMPGLGDDGILRSDRGGVAAGTCTAVNYPSAVAEYTASMPSGLDGFVAQVDCIAARGTSGCGFEQQLEAALTALSPNAPTAYTAPGWTVPMYADGRVGQGDMVNAGFLRDGSILAVLWVTDEDDCSVVDSQLFSFSDPRYAAVDANLRCSTFPDALQPIQRFVDGLVGLRGRPEDVVVAAVTGTPPGFDTTPGALDFNALLALPAMANTVEPVSRNRLLPSCSSANGVAYPPRRIVQTLQGIEARGSRVVLQSICDPTFESLTRDFATQLGQRASGGC